MFAAVAAAAMHWAGSPAVAFLERHARIVSLLLLGPWLGAQLYYAAPFARVFAGWTSRQEFIDRYVALAADFRALDKLLPPQAVLLTDARLPAFHALRPVVFTWRDLHGRAPVYYLRVGEPARPEGPLDCATEVYWNPDARVAAYRNPLALPVRGLVSVRLRAAAIAVRSPRDKRALGAVSFFPGGNIRMNAKFLLLATLLGGLTIFIWGAVSHTALELPGAMYPLKDGTAVIDAIRAQAPANGVYYDARGLLAVVSLRPDMADKSKHMGTNLGIEFATNCMEALLLAFLLWRSRAQGVFERAQLSGLMGLAAFIGLEISYWNWYGFSPRFVMGGLVDIVVGWYLAGLVLGWLMKKMRVAA